MEEENDEEVTGYKENKIPKKSIALLVIEIVSLVIVLYILINTQPPTCKTETDKIYVTCDKLVVENQTLLNYTYFIQTPVDDDNISNCRFVMR